MHVRIVLSISNFKKTFIYDATETTPIIEREPIITIFEMMIVRKIKFSSICIKQSINNIYTFKIRIKLQLDCGIKYINRKDYSFSIDLSIHQLIVLHLQKI